jgi:hypothetical protein
MQSRKYRKRKAAESAVQNVVVIVPLEDSYKCELCFEYFSSLSQVTDHFSKIHTFIGVEYKCRIKVKLSLCLTN